MDNLVLDLSTYASSHPGGAFTINYLVGRDISKFFYGSYALDGNQNGPGHETSAHTHSNIARKIANKHVKYVLATKESQTHQYKISKTNQVNAFTKSFVFDKLPDNNKKDLEMKPSANVKSGT